MPRWDPATYRQFADERARPFVDLTARIGASAPRTVVDLGCGAGELTASLAQRWPEASIEGIDSSAEMIESARTLAAERLTFRLGDATRWRPDRPVDVVVSNAALQWIPDHRELLPGIVDRLAPAGWLAFQVPGNVGAPSHRLLHELAADPRFAVATRGVERLSSHEPETYLADLTALGCRVDAWETTYLHVLSGPDPVLRWISGTGARPVLQALDDTLRAEFVAEYRDLLNRAYPAEPYGTVLPFRRVFVVAQKES